MKSNARNEIINYLSGPRDYNEGAAIYARHGLNLRLKKQFALDQTETTREIMINELKNLAGLTDAEFAALPRRAKAALHDDPHTAPVDEPTPANKTAKEAPEAIKKAVKFREKYTFLQSPDCPDELKILVADMFTALAQYKEAHAAMQAAGDNATAEEMAAKCEAVVENYLKNREIWEELDYYKEHGEILGKAAKLREMADKAAEELAALGDVELMNRMRSAQVQVSKQRAKLAATKGKKKKNERAEAQLEHWSLRLEELKAELERRKKKVTAELTKARAQWAAFEKLLARSTCSACDRAEHGYQMAQVRAKISNLSNLLNSYEEDPKGNS